MSLRICFINNVCAVGGTLGCTASMCKALPDCERMVFAFTAEWRPEPKSMMPPDVLLECGLDKNALGLKLREWKPDVVVFQNTNSNMIPNDFGSGMPIFYQHSAFNAEPSRKRCAKSFVVSKWLAKKAGVSEELILYQPVDKPHEVGKHTDRSHVRLAGRIATPGSAKWKHEDYWEHLVAARAAEPRLHVEFVGSTHDRPESWMLPGHIGYEHRYRVSTWDYMINTCSVEESYGRTVCEAQRVGCVPIVSRRGGQVEQIEHGFDGFLVETPTDVQEALNQLKDDKELERISTNARRSGDERGGLLKWRTEFLKRIAE